MLRLNSREVIFEKFPNGETLFKRDQLDIRTENYIYFKFESDQDLFNLMLLKGELDIAPCKSNRLEIAYYPYSRMDRGSETISFTLKTVSNFINTLKFDEVIVNEPHSEKCIELTNNCVDRNTTKILFEAKKKEIGFDIKKDYILFPDKGASKRYRKDFDGYKTLTANKTRNFENGKIENLTIEGKIENNAKVVIVDDLSSYGGTFLWSATKLKEIGAGDIYLVITHAEKSILEGKIPTDELIKKVYCTDSIMSRSTCDKIVVTPMMEI